MWIREEREMCFARPRVQSHPAESVETTGAMSVTYEYIAGRMGNTG